MTCRALTRYAVGALVAALLYGFAAASVVVVECHSETTKLARGTYTDTFQPLIFSAVITLPLSAAVDAPTYPGTFDKTSYQAVIDHARRDYLKAALIQALPVGLLLAAPPAARRRRRQRTNRVLPVPV
jgi:hypothetical protein